MKQKLLRITLLSMLTILFGGVAQAGENDLLWDYTENNIPTTSPDNNLYFASYVNDPAGTNNGMHGVKLNSSGWAYFKKPAVAGTLTLTFGNRKSSAAYAVNVYNGTLNSDEKTVTKGQLIGDVTVAESPGTNSIELTAEVTGIVIERQTGAEGVLQKIEFKEKKERTFVDFEITNEQLSKTFDPSTLPAGVTFTGNQRNDSHGYDHVTMTVPVDGTVKFTIGGCQYANPANCTVTNAEGKELATPLLKTANCYHQTDKDLNTRAVTYIYVGEPTTLTFSNIAYLPYFKAEATDVKEVTVTYKDQNGNKLGEKKVFEGDVLGEIPYTEADLTIPAGEKFRGWVYTNKTKVKATDIVNGDLSVNASVTPIEEAPTVGTIQLYDLTQATFYPEDHENFDVVDGKYYNNHGFDFAANGYFTVAVTGKAQIVLTLCQYGNGTTITVTDPNGGTVRDDVPAKAASDGDITAINYEGPAGQLKFQFASQSYLHKVAVYNVSDFVEKDAESGYYIIPANDGASLVLALNAAASDPNAKIFLPNGTYDLGEATETPVSGTNVSIIGESTEGVTIKNAPPVSKEGLRTAATLTNTGTGLYLQDITIKNELDYFNAGSAGRANTLCENGDKTVAKNIRMLSYQDTYVTTVGKHYYWEDCEIHGVVDYICGGSDVFFEKCLLVNESKKQGVKDSEATITAHQPKTEEKFGFVFNNCTIENNAKTFNLGRAWGGATDATVRPMATYLNTTLNQPDEINPTRFLLKGMNSQSGVFHEYNSKNSEGTVVSPASLEETFTNNSGGDALTYDIILTEEQAANYTIEKVLGDWASTAKQAAAQLKAPDAVYSNGNVTWTPANNGATAYMIEKNGEFVGITAGTSYTIGEIGEKDELTIRAANGRGGFGEAKIVSKTATSIKAINAAMERGEQVIFNLAGQRVNKASKGLYIINGKKTIVK